MGSETRIRKRLLAWYRAARRPLPWRRTKDPYRIWLSEVMLQQTRVAAVLPYYRRFLEQFPTVEALAAAPEQDLLAAWSGLGYYSRARNLRKAARQIVRLGEFPRSYDALRRLPGIGDYTAAAVASIAFNEPRPAVDGNVLRVLSRLSNDSGDIRSASTRRRLQALAGRLLDRQQPGEFNQAVMELGAVVCLPRFPKCAECPMSRCCAARRHGRQNDLPVRSPRSPRVTIDQTLLVIERRGRLLLRRRPSGSARLAGFWELPVAAELPSAQIGGQRGGFQHSITNHEYRFAVVTATIRKAPPGFRWIERARLPGLPLSAAAKKALALLDANGR